MRRELSWFFLVLLLPVGCAGRGTGAASTAHTHDPSSHNHDRGHMMMASNGAVDALLTSHLSSKDGNELDVFIEKRGTPLALGTTSLEAKAHVRGEEKQLSFVCAPPEERPKAEAPNTCSHFVARAEWMSPEDRVDVTANLRLLVGEVGYTWRRFDPRKYAHHIE